MSTKLRNADKHSLKLPRIEHLKVGIVVAEWNGHITEALLKGALNVFWKEGYSRDAIIVKRVPGSIELTFAASYMVDFYDLDAVIVIGCVIRGGTPHFDYVCQSVTQGITALNERAIMPVIFGVLTTDDEQQALDRAGGQLGNKGAEAAETAIKMIALEREMMEELDGDDEDDDIPLLPLC